MSATSGTDNSAELGLSSNEVEPSSEGYDEHFDPPLESKYECPLCHLGLREPVQTSCGHRFCCHCIVNSIRNCGLSKCPAESCHKSITTSQIYPDKFAEREMMTLQVFCQANRENECLWKGNLVELENHRSECPYVMVGCPNDCEKQVKRKDLQQHMAAECLLRKISCDYCNEAVLWNELEQHFENCPQYPQRCNMCEKDGIERGKMEYHLERVCVNVRIKCPLHTFGCSFEGLRSDVNKHIMEQLSSHVNDCLKFHQLQEDQEGRLTQQQQSELEELKNRVTQLSNEVLRLERQLKATEEAHMRLETPLREQEIMLRKQAGRFCDGTYTWKIEKFGDCYQGAISGASTTNYSPPFYTSLYPGYKLCMRINMNGVDDGVGKHVALFMHLMRGDHDDFLQWPFAKKFKLSILDQSEDKGEHHDISETLVAEPKLQACQRPVAPHNYYGLGYPKFAPIELICQPQYTKNDTLLVKFEMIG